MAHRDEVWLDGTCIEAWEFDVPTRSVIHEVDGVVVGSRPMTDSEWSVHAPFPPLDPTGALATLLVVEGVLPLGDAANAIHEEPAHLIAEAQAWSLG